MKLNKPCTVTLFALILALTTVGCKTKSTGVTPLGDRGTTGGAEVGSKPKIDDGLKASSTPGDVVASNSQEDPDKRRDWLRDREIFKSDTVHFDYDSSVIKNEEKTKIAAVAEYIKAHPMDALEIDGHCDIRGTEEYNRSLGERRALALREELIRLGIEPSKIDTVSYGEDRPADTGHDDAAYRKNRRGEFPSWPSAGRLKQAALKAGPFVGS